MKKFIIASILLTAIDVFACSLINTFEIDVKNKMVISAITNLGLEVEKIHDLKTSDYVFNYAWTYSDPGAGCHDTEKGSITVSYSADAIYGSFAAQYDVDLKAQYEALMNANPIDWQAVADFESKTYACDVVANIVHTLDPIPPSQQGFAFPYDRIESATVVCKK